MVCLQPNITPVLVNLKFPFVCFLFVLCCCYQNIWLPVRSSEHTLTFRWSRKEGSEAKRMLPGILPPPSIFALPCLTSCQQRLDGRVRGHSRSVTRSLFSSFSIYLFVFRDTTSWCPLDPTLVWNALDRCGWSWTSECRGCRGETLCLVYVALVIRPRVKGILFLVVVDCTN